MVNTDQDKAAEIVREFQRMQGERTNWESHWEEVARLVLPSYAGVFTSMGTRTDGAKRTEYQYDSTAGSALVKFASVMESMLTPRNQTWHRLQPSDPYLMKDRASRLWFDEATRVLFDYRQQPKANFQAQNHENYMALGAFGTGCLFIDQLQPRGLRYRAVHLGEIYFAENHQGLIDKAIRRFQLTARQAKQKWGDKISPKITERADKSPEDKFWFVHCVKPREDVDSNRMDYKGRPFASYYVEEETKVMVSEGGFGTFPYAISRYVQAPGETYGRGPAMECLPAIKVLNEEKKTMLKQGHRIVDPVILAADDGVLDSFSLKPGAVNYGSMSADGKRLVDILPTGNLAVAQEMMQMERLSIHDAFLITLFQILTETPTMTATEVLERTREKGMLLSPTMGRQQSEYLGPMIDRELDLLVEQFLLPPMPPALLEARGEYKIEYDSPLSRAQKAEEVAGLWRSLELPLKVAEITQNPEPLDHYDWDVIIPESSRIQAVPERWLRAAEAVQARRDERAEAAQTQQMIEAAPAVAGLMKAAPNAAK